MDSRKAAENQPNYPSIVFVYQGSVDAGLAFFERFAADARAIADSAKTFYKAFGLDRGSLRQVLGPAVWSRGFEAWREGHRLGKPVGDPRQMPGVFLVEADRILWSFRPDTAGEMPRYEDIPNMIVS